MKIGFDDVTEAPGIRVSREAMQMVYHRYQIALEHCQGKDILEVACGAGMGLGYLAKKAKAVVAGDYAEKLITKAKFHYKDRIPLLRLDAHNLPFKDQSFDRILLSEAIYYLSDPSRFLQECRRLLRAGGIVLISTANKEWLDFNPSALSTRYFSAQELCELLRGCQFQASIYGAFQTTKAYRGDWLLSWIKRIAVSAHLIPKTMKSKEWLKRIFFGELLTLPAELDGAKLEFTPATPIVPGVSADSFKVLYAVGRL